MPASPGRADPTLLAKESLTAIAGLRRKEESGHNTDFG